MCTFRQSPLKKIKLLQKMFKYSILKIIKTKILSHIDLPQSMTKGRKLPRARYVAFLSLSVTQDTTKPTQGAELVIP